MKETSRIVFHIIFRTVFIKANIFMHRTISVVSNYEGKHDECNFEKLTILAMTHTGESPLQRDSKK